MGPSGQILDELLVGAEKRKLEMDNLKGKL
jgi:hypothetical protein